MKKKEILEKLNNLKTKYIYQRYNGIITKYEVRDNYLIDIRNANNTIDTNTQIPLGKTSENIIDLIEVGDIVNGCRVMSVLYLKGKKETRVANFKLIDGQTYTGEIDYEGKKREFNLVVETILTHEIYEREAYKIE